MVKGFVYIVFLLVSIPCLLLAKAKNSHKQQGIVLHYNIVFTEPVISTITDTVKTVKVPSKTDAKVKEVAKAKKQPKPEKVDEADDKKAKPKRQRRPDGMERPPEIPRRNDN
ncbi:MAG: hypothetical protein V4592_01240 [Bacteroidota bacterium]